MLRQNYVLGIEFVDKKIDGFGSDSDEDEIVVDLQPYVEKLKVIHLMLSSNFSAHTYEVDLAYRTISVCPYSIFMCFVASCSLHTAVVVAKFRYGRIIVWVSIFVDASNNVDVEKLISFSKDLVQFLKEDKDVSFLKQCKEQSDALQSHCHTEYQTLQNSIQDYQGKINACKQRTTEAQSEAAADAEIDKLQKELEEQEIHREQLLREELRVITDEINDLDRQRDSIDEQRKLLKKLDQDQLQAEMKLSPYASVTSIILDSDDQSKISGHIVERDKVVENFEFDPSKLTAFDICNNIWKMINL